MDDASQHGSILFINKSSVGIVAGFYTLSVTATNFFGLSDTRTVLFNRAEGRVAYLTSPAGDYFHIQSNKLNWLTVRMATQCFNATSAVQFAWSQISGPPISMSAAMIRTLASSRLYIPPILTAGSQYQFRVVAFVDTETTAHGETLLGETTISVDVDPAPLHVFITGGNRAVPAESNSNLTLEAHAEGTTDANIMWSCTIPTRLHQPCFYGAFSRLLRTFP